MIWPMQPFEPARKEPELAEIGNSEGFQEGNPVAVMTCHLIEPA